MGLYTAAHADPKGAGDARPTALQVVRDEALEGRLVGKVIVITGATSGIGLETARALAATGATLYLTVRDVRKAKTTLADFLTTGQISLVEMNNASFTSVRTAAAEILASSNGQINTLITNAGIMGLPDRQLTEDGYEMHFATNHLGHFLLYQVLKSALLASSSPEYHSRVVALSSSAQRARGLNESDNYNFEKGGYQYNLAYANSKLANVYMANAIDRRYGSKGLHATSVHPGAIYTPIARHLDEETKAYILNSEIVQKIGKSPEQGAATTVIAAVGSEWAKRGGRYLEDCEEAKQGEDNHSIFDAGYVPHTYNEAEEERLWRDSLKMLGLSQDL